MKPFDDLSHEDLIALTDEQVAYYIDRECAENGVPLLPPTVPVAPEIASIEKRAIHYVIAGLRFADEQDARNVERAIAATKSLRTVQHVGGQYSWSGPTFDVPETEDRPVVTIDRVFDAAGAAAQKAEDDAKATRKAAYETAKKEYDAAVSGRENVARSIRSAIASAWTLENRRQRLLSEYERYLPLANGDGLIAKRFLQRAHGDARDVLPHLFPDGWEDEPVRHAPAEEVVDL